MRTEWFPLVNEEGETIGKATRKECHSGSKLLHPVIHLHIFNKDGDLYLQKRSMNKDIQPGKWDTAVGGHIDYGESVEEAQTLYIRVFHREGIGKQLPDHLRWPHHPRSRGTGRRTFLADRGDQRESGERRIHPEFRKGIHRYFPIR